MGSDNNDDDLPSADNYPIIKFGKRTVDARALLIIDTENLVHDYATIHHWITVTSTKVASYTVIISQAKRDLARLEARIHKAARQADKKPTESVLKDVVTLDTDYIAAQEAIAAKEATKGRYAIFLTALENKRDMLINLGAELRKRSKYSGE